MSWHIFSLLWGEPFVKRFAELVVPFLEAPGNVPVLARDGEVTFHIYTDTASHAVVRAALAPFARDCRFDIRVFDPAWAGGLSGVDFKYELQRGCHRDLATHVPSGEPVVLLDSNFVPADGTFAALAARRAQGYTAVAVSVLRVASETFAPSFSDRGPRALVAASFAALHPMSERFFVDACPFTAYPSQLSWRVGSGAIVNHNFLPHPLMIPASPALAQYQSSMDYDLALRSAADDAVYMCADSDEMLVVKFSDSGHAADASAEQAPSTDDLGRFLLAATNRRHRLFADTSVVFHVNDVDAQIEAARAHARAVIDEAYGWIDRAAAQPTRLDARNLLYIKSHFGSIEEFISPQLEAATTARFA